MKYRCGFCGGAHAPERLHTATRLATWNGTTIRRGWPFCTGHFVELVGSDGSLSEGVTRSLARSLREGRPDYILKAAKASEVKE